MIDPRVAAQAAEIARARAGGGSPGAVPGVASAGQAAPVAAGPDPRQVVEGVKMLLAKAIQLLESLGG
jgi:hypothetical protein